MSRRPHSSHWYRIYVCECPLCGHDFGHRERVYGEKPKDHRERYVYEQPRACWNHFL